MQDTTMLQRSSNVARSIALLALLAVSACSDAGTEPGVITLTPSVTGLSFGVKEAGDPPVVRTFQITNNGTALSEPLVVTIEGTGAASFTVAEPASSCIDLELTPGESCVVSIQFGGTAAGPQSATAFVDGGQDGQRIGVTLNGILQAELNVFLQGSGQGGVRVQPDGPMCNAVCSLSLVVPTVTLVPVPAANSRFVEWIGAPGCATNEQCTLTLADLNAVTVRFDLR